MSGETESLSQPEATPAQPQETHEAGEFSASQSSIQQVYEPGPAPRRDRIARKKERFQIREGGDGQPRMFRGDQELKPADHRSIEQQVVKDETSKLINEYNFTTARSLDTPNKDTGSTETPEATGSPSEAAVEGALPRAPEASTNKRDKDTERAFHEAQRQVKEYQEREKQYGQVLNQIYAVAQANPEAFQQLFSGQQAQPQMSDDEFAEAINSGRQGFRHILQQELREIIPTLVGEHPVIKKQTQKEAAAVAFKAWASQTFGEQGLESPEYKEAQPFMTALASVYQAQGQQVPIDHAWTTWTALKKLIASSKGQPVGANGKGKTATSNSSPESFPSQNTRPLPSRNTGVAGRNIAPENRDSLRGMNKREKIEHLGEQLFGQYARSRSR